MNKAHIQLLNQRYKEACNEYLKAFCQTYELQYEEDAWVAGDVGTIALIGDYYINIVLTHTTLDLVFRTFHHGTKDAQD